MKTTLILATLIVSLLFGCNGGNILKPIAATEITSITDAKNIIGYTNNVIEMMDKYIETATNTSIYYQDLKNSWSTKTAYTGFSNDMNFIFSVNSQAAIAFATPTPSLGNEQAFFADSLAKFKKLFDTYKMQDSAIGLYVKAQDYKDDNYAKGQSLIQSQLEIYPQLMSLTKNINNKIEILADAAEEVTLKNNPLKKEIKLAKADLKKFEKLAKLIGNKESYTIADIEAINLEYEKFSENLLKNAAIDKTALTKANKTVMYDVLYKNFATQAATFKSVIRNISTTKKISELDYNYVTSGYDVIITCYNVWVQ